jgi:hypothetical protein
VRAEEAWSASQGGRRSSRSAPQWGEEEACEARGPKGGLMDGMMILSISAMGIGLFLLGFGAGRWSARRAEASEIVVEHEDEDTAERTRYLQ